MNGSHSRLLQQLDKLRTDSLTAGSRESQASACIRAHTPCLHALLHPSRKKKKKANACRHYRQQRSNSKLVSSVSLSPTPHHALHWFLTCLHWDAQVGRNTATLPLKPMETTCADLPGFLICTSLTPPTQKSIALRLIPNCNSFPKGLPCWSLSVHLPFCIGLSR